MAPAEYAVASQCNWADSDLVIGDPEEMGKKWLWTDLSAAERWRDEIESREGPQVIAEVSTKHPLEVYGSIPHPPHGFAVHVPIEDLGAASRL